MATAGGNKLTRSNLPATEGISQFRVIEKHLRGLHGPADRHSAAGGGIIEFDDAVRIQMIAGVEFLPHLHLPAGSFIRQSLCNLRGGIHGPAALAAAPFQVIALILRQHPLKHLRGADSARFVDIPPFIGIFPQTRTGFVVIQANLTSDDLDIQLEKLVFHIVRISYIQRLEITGIIQLYTVAGDGVAKTITQRRQAQVNKLSLGGQGIAAIRLPGVTQ